MVIAVLKSNIVCLTMSFNSYIIYLFSSKYDIEYLDIRFCLYRPAYIYCPPTSYKSIIKFLNNETVSQAKSSLAPNGVLQTSSSQIEAEEANLPRP